MRMTRLFQNFFDSEKASGVVLLLCTGLSLLLTNSVLGETYTGLWHISLGGHPLEFWINDGLMTIFFLMVGLELEREVYIGELSQRRQAMLPAIAALGGMVVPAGIHAVLNFGTSTSAGAGIPMATDIAFAIGILSLLGSRVPVSLKIFLTALAVIDDLGAIITIAVFYSSDLSLMDLGIAGGIFAVLGALNRLKVLALWPYLLLGAIMWIFMLRSGVHATISGVLLAFVIPFGTGNAKSISYRLQNFLHKPVAFVIMPLFALANTCIVFGGEWSSELFSSNSVGIFLGLVIGKPLGIALFSGVAVAVGWCVLPGDVRWKDLIGVGFLGGIGFTMSIFITLLAFDDPHTIVHAKTAILIASFAASLAGGTWLTLALRRARKRRVRS